jgi:hypothetical protein
MYSLGSEAFRTYFVSQPGKLFNPINSVLTKSEEINYDQTLRPFQITFLVRCFWIDRNAIIVKLSICTGCKARL